MAKKKYNYRQDFKSISPFQHTVRGAKTEAKHKFKQKPIYKGGTYTQSQKGSSYGIRAIEAKVHPKAFGAIVRRMPYVGSRETWTGEMERMYGGIHMSQTRAGTKRSIKLLMRNWNKRFAA